MLYDLVPIIAISGGIIVGITALIIAGQVRKVKEEGLNRELVEALSIELTQIKESLASIEKMMKDIE